MINIKEIYIRDPFVFVEDDVAYLVGTTNKAPWGSGKSSFVGYKSKDLVNFEGPFVLFQCSPDFWGKENYWAPELHKVDGRYLLFCSFFTPGLLRRSHVLECDKPLGEYKPLKTAFTPKDWMSLDATLYEEDGIYYTVFCHEWDQIYDGEMVLGKFKGTNFEELDGEPITLFKASDAKWVRIHHFPQHDGYVTDGPFIYKLKNNNLLMLWSSFSKDGYALGTALSENGIKGPWIQSEEPLFNCDGGHAMIFEFKGQKYLSLHAPNHPNYSERAHFLKISELENSIKIEE